MYPLNKDMSEVRFRCDDSLIDYMKDQAQGAIIISIPKKKLIRFLVIRHRKRYILTKITNPKPTKA